MQGGTVRCMTLVIPTFRREAPVDRQPHKVETPQVVLNPAEPCTLTDSGPRTSLSFHVRAIHELIGASAGATTSGPAHHLLFMWLWAGCFIPHSHVSHAQMRGKLNICQPGQMQQRALYASPG